MKLTSHSAINSYSVGPAVVSSRNDSLANLIVELIPREGNVLHIGCGDGSLTSRLATILPSVRFRGVEQFVSKGGRIPIHAYDGIGLPFGDDSFDAVILIDTLNGSPDPKTLLSESKRVTRNRIVLKDKVYRGLVESTRRLVSWGGSEPKPMSSQRLSKSQLLRYVADLGLTIEQWNRHLRVRSDRRSSRFLSRTSHFTAQLSANS